jgi:predicted SAM-dependent methyltransferase
MLRTILKFLSTKVRASSTLGGGFYSYLKRATADYDKPPPIYAKTLGTGIRVHLGAGPINLQGWVNIDARQAPHVHIVTEVLELSEFTDASIAEIYMCHVLEHFSFQEVEDLLQTFRRKLMVGGVLRLAVPDFDKLVTVYKSENNDLSMIKLALMGGQDYQFNFHKAVFNEKSLNESLGRAGYGDIQLWETEADFGADLGDWSNQNFITASGTYPISLNIKATKVS